MNPLNPLWFRYCIHLFVLSYYLQTGNFYINGRNYDISPTLEKISKRIVDSELLGVPHILVENKEQHEESTRMLQDTDAVDPSGAVVPANSGSNVVFCL